MKLFCANPKFADEPGVRFFGDGLGDLVNLSVRHTISSRTERGKAERVWLRSPVDMLMNPASYVPELIHRVAGKIFDPVQGEDHIGQHYSAC